MSTGYDYIKRHPIPPETLVTEALASSSDESSNVMDDSDHEPASPYMPSVASASAPTIAASGPGTLPSASHEGDTDIANISSSYEDTPYPYYHRMAQDQYENANESAPANTADIGGAAESDSHSWLKISLHRVSHLTRRDEYTFTTLDGKLKSTDKDEWAKVNYKEKTAWYFRYKGTFYYTRVRPGP